MAQTWVPSFRKRLLLEALDILARLAPPRGHTAEVDSRRQIKRILVVELWNIGDVVLAMPFLAQLRALFPTARITMLARPHAETILAGTGLVDEFIETELGWTERATRFNPLGYNWSELRRVGRELRGRRFDIAFKSRMHIREHLLLAISGATRRVAFAFGHGDRVLTDAIPVGDPNRHKAADWLELLKPFGGSVEGTTTRLKVNEAERRRAADFLAAHGVSPNDRVVAIHPGASVPAKRWPLKSFVDVARVLAQRPGVKVVAFVDPEGYGDGVARLERVIRAKPNLRELIALIQRCDVLVCNDSGPMHLAGALGVPTVAVFAADIQQWFAPLGEGHRFLSDIASVTPSQVIDAVDATLRANRDSDRVGEDLPDVNRNQSLR
jgi:ADP-heptose:LPS heptosyltransferase